jgi:O-antigen/teichoic acid export membrane protein
MMTFDNLSWVSFFSKRPDTLSCFMSRKTTIHVLINTIGTYLNVAFSMIFVFVLTRLMGKVEYGTLLVLLTIMYLGATILDGGVTTIIFAKLPAAFAKRDFSTSYAYIKSILYYQTICVITLIYIFIFLFPTLDHYFLHTDATWVTYSFVGLSILMFVWQNTVQNILLAAGKFALTNVWFNVSNLARLVLFPLLHITGTLTMSLVVFVFGIIGPLTFLGAIALMYRSHLRPIWYTKPDITYLDVRQVLTGFAAQQMFSTGMRADLFILKYLRLDSAVGDYGLAQKIILAIISVVVSTTQVLSPKFSHVHSRSQLRSLLRQSVSYLMIPTVLFLLLLCIPEWVFELVFTDKFAEALPLTRMLGLAYATFALSQIPWLALLYTFKKHGILLVTNTIFLVVNTTCTLIAVLLWGPIGGPLAIGVSFFTITVVQSIFVYRAYLSLPEAVDA